jgi:hypothetical protein
MKTTRGLSLDLMFALKDGILNPLLEAVKRDDTLCLQIRNDYFNIYYRGGSILKLENKKGLFYSNFDTAYFKPIEARRRELLSTSLPKLIKSISESKKWVELMPLLKQAMDEYFSKYAKSEREFQQLVARENNNSIVANDTDYYITDIEYTSTASMNSRFDLVGIKWESSSSNRKKTDKCRLVLIEMKYGDNAIGGSAGIKKHLDDIEEFCGDTTKLKALKEETLTCFEQLRELGLVRFGKNGNPNKITSLEEKPEFMLLLANHKPAKGKLKSELGGLEELKYSDLKIATASFMGYGLYARNMHTLQRFNQFNYEF